MRIKRHFFMGMILFCAPCFSENKYSTKESALDYYMNRHNNSDNMFQIKAIDMKILDVDGKDGDDIFIVNPNLCGSINGCGGGVFLCQGKKKDCSDGYFCEADVKVFFEKDIKSKGKDLNCKK